MQQKDVIYIDVEDDITAIIGKVKAAKQKIVALVPPKRTGVLQSAVNLRLLSRAADSADKRLVLITGNSALGSLAASAKIPVAKNLQSRPEIAEIPALAVDDDDVIDGSSLPVGDHAATTVDAKSDVVPPGAMENLDIDGEAAPLKPKRTDAPKTKKGIKVPDFGSFRKRMALGIGGGILLIVFLVWAFVFAPRATVVISAKTSDIVVKSPVSIGDNLQTNSDKATLASVTKTDKESMSVDVPATGTKDVGDKATGTMTITRNGVSDQSATIPAGTGFSSGNYTFVTTAAATVPASSIKGISLDHGSVTVGVRAMDIGDGYNLSARDYDSSVSGYSASGTQMSGGSKRTVKVVTSDDLQKAQDNLVKQNTDAAKAKVKKLFASDVVVIDSSFVAKTDNMNLTPGAGEEAPDGKAKLTTDVTYTMVGVAKDDLDNYLKPAVTKQLTSEKSQRIYDSGAASAKLTEYQPASGQDPATVQLVATAKVGPKINDDDIKEQVKGKRTGEVIGDLKAIDGVSDVDVNLSPFWVTSIPGDVNKITVEFKLQANG